MRDPHVVVIPLVTKRSLYATGTPSYGDRKLPVRRRSSEACASSRARLSVLARNAAILPSTSFERAIRDSVMPTDVASPRSRAPANSVADAHAGTALTPHPR